jgi:hypothetical protein
MLPLLAAVASVLVHGVVLIGPTTPVCREGIPCSKPAAHVLIEFTQASKIRMATTDARGRYSVRLEPGTWTVLATRGVRTTPSRFVVRHVVSQRRDFALDTGIR